MRFLKILTSFLFLMNLQAIQAGETLTAFFLSTKQYGSEGKEIEEAFFLSDGDFRLEEGTYHDGIQFIFHRLDQEGEWRIEFSGPHKEPLKVGVYKNARRTSFNRNAPGFSVTHNSSMSSGGDFEILELKYDKDGKVVAFAANFARSSSSFGSIRVNSSIPVEKRFKQYFQKNTDPSVIYLSKKNAMTGEKSQPVIITDDPSTLSISQLPFGGDGIQVLVKGHLEKWIFDFAAPIGGILDKGRYDTSYRYPFHGYSEAGIGVSKSRSTAAMPVGYFEVEEIQRNPTGQFVHLKLKFEIETEEGEIYEGIIRYTLPEQVIKKDSDCYTLPEQVIEEDLDCHTLSEQVIEED